MPLYKRSAYNTRVYDKQLSCYFCHKLLKQKMKRHLETVHKNEPEVSSILLNSKKKQTLLFAGLVCRGNFNHNIRVLEKGVGELIVGRRPTTTTRSDDYLPCIYCFSFYLSRDLNVHTSSCHFKPRESEESVTNKSSSDNKDILGKSRMLLSGALHVDYASVPAKFQTEVIGKMRYDKLTQYVRTDTLILKYGSTLHRRHGRIRCNDMSQKMRQLARLVLAVREAETGAQSMATLESLISGVGFDYVLTATESL